MYGSDARNAKCHGAMGEGTSSYKKALTGTRSIPELSAFIAKNMPPGAPRVSAAFQLQRRPEVPHGVHDQKIEIVVTEAGITSVAAHT